jgi:ABC-type Zn uptake system ZnuABC Zn-binding protein ZnuA
VTRFFAAVSVVACCMTLGACGGASPSVSAPTEPPAAKKHVVVTNSILGDFVSVIGSSQIDLTVLTPQNVDPHDYELTSSDVTTIANADLLIENGLGLEPSFDDFIKKADLKGPVVKASTGISTRFNETGAVDPYIWVSPSNARVMVSNVREALAQLVPDAKTEFESNERAYDAQLDNVITYERQVMASVQSRKLAYVGEPLGYFCDEFHLACTAVNASDVTKKVPPTNAQVNAVLNAVKALDAAAIVVGPEVPKAIATNIQTLVPTARVTSGDDALRVESVGDASTRHPDYLSLQRDIADLLSANLR